MTCIRDHIILYQAAEDADDSQALEDGYQALENYIKRYKIVPRGPDRIQGTVEHTALMKIIASYPQDFMLTYFYQLVTQCFNLSHPVDVAQLSIFSSTAPRPSTPPDDTEHFSSGLFGTAALVDEDAMPEEYRKLIHSTYGKVG